MLYTHNDGNFEQFSTICPGCRATRPKNIRLCMKYSIYGSTFPLPPPDNADNIYSKTTSSSVLRYAENTARYLEERNAKRLYMILCLKEKLQPLPENLHSGGGRWRAGGRVRFITGYYFNRKRAPSTAAHNSLIPARSCSGADLSQIVFPSYSYTHKTPKFYHSKPVHYTPQVLEAPASSLSLDAFFGHRKRRRRLTPKYNS